MNVRISALTIKAPLNKTSKTVRADEVFSSARRRCGKFVGKGFLHRFSPAFMTCNAIRNKTFEINIAASG